MLFFLEQSAVATISAPWLLVLMHGVGSNEKDLMGLATHVPPQFHVLSLRAPNMLGPGSYAWFEFDVLSGGARRIDRAQEAASRAQLVQEITGHAQRLAVPAERVVIGGFSQGGIMALSLLLTQPQLAHAAMVMHSRMLPEIEVALAAPVRLQGKHLWVSHGLQDAVIPLASAQAIVQRVQGWPLQLRYTEFAGGHEINLPELKAAMAWLGEISAA